MVQIHIDCDRSFYEKFKKAFKKTDWRTISEFFRAKMREAIKQATEDFSTPRKLFYDKKRSLGLNQNSAQTSIAESIKDKPSIPIFLYRSIFCSQCPDSDYCKINRDQMIACILCVLADESRQSN